MIRNRYYTKFGLYEIIEAIGTTYELKSFNFLRRYGRSAVSCRIRKQFSAFFRNEISQYYWEYSYDGIRKIPRQGFSEYENDTYV